MSIQLSYVILLFSLFVLPKIFQRYRIPSAITSFALGVACGQGLGLFHSDSTVVLLSMFGIVSLFLLAGLEADLQALRYETHIIVQHLVISLVLLMLVAFGIEYLTGFDLRISSLISLAILTPSTGFILDSLGAYQMDDREKFWVKTKAIATEFLALGTLFVVLQSTTVRSFGISSSALILMVLLLPLLFRAYAKWVMPYAPRSEFTFLLMMAVICAYFTKKLGVYYLVGAFVVGLAAQRFRKRLPSIASGKLLHAMELFSSFFIPFYFFYAGLSTQQGDFSLKALALALILIVVFIPMQVAKVMIHRRLALKEPLRRSARIGLSMSPTLVFTLVIAQILRDQFHLESFIFGGLVLYAILNTLIPSMIFQDPTPDFESHQLEELDF
ncbi:MAG: cation:proton antiporter [Bdellovibrionota bacterium]